MMGIKQFEAPSWMQLNSPRNEQYVKSIVEAPRCGGKHKVMSRSKSRVGCEVEKILTVSLSCAIKRLMLLTSLILLTTEEFVCLTKPKSENPFQRLLA